MSRRRYRRRSTSLPFAIFRTLISLCVFAILAAGVYTAYKHFSGYDPAGVDPKNVAVEILASLDKQGVLTSKLFPKFGVKEAVPDQEVVNQTEQGSPATPNQPPPRSAIFKFMLVADSHSDNENLKKALNQGDKDIEFVVGLGDYTNVGTQAELEQAKKEFDGSGVRYFVTAGDHDLWDSRDKGKHPMDAFGRVFGGAYQSFTFDGVRFIILNNSDNYHGLGENQKNWLHSEVAKIKTETLRSVIVLTHEPLYHPSSSRIMGKVTPSLLKEARDIIRELKTVNTKGVLSGDIHYFTEYADPESGIAMVTVGAITAERNIQNPRYAVVTMYDDGSFSVKDIEVE